MEGMNLSATRIISIDAGNKDVKAVLGDLKNSLTFPNVLCPLPEKRDFIEDDSGYFDAEMDGGGILNNLHFRVKSEALRELNNKIFGAGALAARNKKGKIEVPERATKATNDQILIMYLLAAAIDAVKTHQPDSTNTIHYKAVLSAFLPVVDVQKGLKSEFQQRLERHTHEIQFLQTPGAENVTVRIQFVRVYTNTEGVAAVIDLAIAEPTNYHIADSTLLSKKILVSEIGGNTTEMPIVSHGKLDRYNSDGIRVGTSAYLDEIIREIESNYEHEVSSRERLVEYIKSDTHPCQIKIKGVYHSFQEISDRHLQSCATRIYERIDRIWKNVDDLDVTLCIGGGSILLQKYLNEINQNSGKYPFLFVDDEKLVPFLNARGGWKVAYRKEEKIRKQAVV